MTKYVEIIDNHSTCPFCGITQNVLEMNQCKHIVEAYFGSDDNENDIKMIYED